MSLLFYLIHAVVAIWYKGKCWQGSSRLAKKAVVKGNGWMVLAVVLSGCAAWPNYRGHWERYDFSEPKMGTYFKVSCYAPDSLVASEAVKLAFQEVDKLNDALSDYHPESELNRLSATSGEGIWVPVSDPLWGVLNLSVAASRVTGGAFDATVGTYVKLWRRARMQGKLPSKVRMELAKQSTGYQWVHLDTAKQAVMLEKPGMKLDLGGIAKGYTADKMLEIFQSLGLRMVLIDAGGDLVAGEPPPDRSAWEVSVEQGETRDPFQVDLANQAVATSGDLYQYIELEGERYSHIVDPSTGIGLQKQVAVTVVAPTGAQADFLASAMSVMSLQKAEVLSNELQKVHVYITELKDGELSSFATGVFEQLTTAKP